MAISNHRLAAFDEAAAEYPMLLNIHIPSRDHRDLG
jgi:hypothetical protein